MFNCLKKKKFSIFFTLLTLLLSNSSNAGSIGGLVNNYWTDSGAFYFQIAGTINNKPACNSSARFVVPLNSNLGQAIIPQIISAKAQGFTVNAVGQNYCSFTGDSEDLRYIGVVGTGTPNVPTNYFWLTSDGGNPCSAICSSSNLVAAANQQGYVCKDTQGNSYGTEYKENAPDAQWGSSVYYGCGSTSRTAQCSCVKP